MNVEFGSWNIYKRSFEGHVGPGGAWALSQHAQTFEVHGSRLLQVLAERDLRHDRHPPHIWRLPGPSAGLFQEIVAGLGDEAGKQAAPP